LFRISGAHAGRRIEWLLVGLMGAFWAVTDELSQGLPGLGRVVTWHDLLANLCGVIGALALIWAMAPLQPPDQLAAPNRARSRLFEFAFDEMFATPRPWIIGAAVALACAAIIAVMRPLLPSPRAVGTFGLALVMVALPMLYLVYRRIFFQHFARLIAERPCLQCGAAAAKPDRAHLERACSTCGSPVSAADYIVPQRPSLRATIAVSVAPIATAILGVGAMFGLVLLVPYLYSWSIATPGAPGRTTAPRLAQMVGRLPRELNSVIDLTVYLLLIALVVRMWRRRMAAHIDRGFRCRRCGHDLHGTPVNEQGEGQCGECGEPFARSRDTQPIVTT
jgi:hypothetical protein